MPKTKSAKKTKKRVRKNVKRNTMKAYLEYIKKIGGNGMTKQQIDDYENKPISMDDFLAEPDFLTESGFSIDYESNKTKYNVYPTYAPLFFTKIEWLHAYFNRCKTQRDSVFFKEYKSSEPVNPANAKSAAKGANCRNIDAIHKKFTNVNPEEDDGSSVTPSLYKKATSYFTKSQNYTDAQKASYRNKLKEELCSTKDLYCEYDKKQNVCVSKPDSEIFCFDILPDSLSEEDLKKILGGETFKEYIQKLQLSKSRQDYLYDLYQKEAILGFTKCMTAKNNDYKWYEAHKSLYDHFNWENVINSAGYLNIWGIVSSKNIKTQQIINNMKDVIRQHYANIHEKNIILQQANTINTSNSSIKLQTSKRKEYIELFTYCSLKTKPKDEHDTFKANLNMYLKDHISNFELAYFIYSILEKIKLQEKRNKELKNYYTLTSWTDYFAGYVPKPGEVEQGLCEDLFNIMFLQETVNSITNKKERIITEFEILLYIKPERFEKTRTDNYYIDMMTKWAHFMWSFGYSGANFVSFLFRCIISMMEFILPLLLIIVILLKTGWLENMLRSILGVPGGNMATVGITNITLEIVCYMMQYAKFDTLIQTVVGMKLFVFLFSSSATYKESAEKFDKQIKEFETQDIKFITEKMKLEDGNGKEVNLSWLDTMKYTYKNKDGKESEISANTIFESLARRFNLSKGTVTLIVVNFICWLLIHMFTDCKNGSQLNVLSCKDENCQEIITALHDTFKESAEFRNSLIMEILDKIQGIFVQLPKFFKGQAVDSKIWIIEHWKVVKGVNYRVENVRELVDIKYDDYILFFKASLSEIGINIDRIWMNTIGLLQATVIDPNIVTTRIANMTTPEFADHVIRGVPLVGPLYKGVGAVGEEGMKFGYNYIAYPIGKYVFYDVGQYIMKAVLSLPAQELGRII